MPLTFCKNSSGINSKTKRLWLGTAHVFRSVQCDDGKGVCCGVVNCELHRLQLQCRHRTARNPYACMVPWPELLFTLGKCWERVLGLEHDMSAKPTCLSESWYDARLQYAGVGFWMLRSFVVSLNETGEGSGGHPGRVISSSGA